MLISGHEFSSECLIAVGNIDLRRYIPNTSPKDWNNLHILEAFFIPISDQEFFSEYLHTTNELIFFIDFFF